MPSSPLGDYLRSRRASVTPDELGLPPGLRQRRVEGLRREEIAELAGVNVDYYARLEQGRESSPSPLMVEAIGRALRLDADAHEHLRRLAGVQPLPVRPPAREVAPGLRALLDQWQANPAFVLNGALDILAANALGDALHSGFERADNLALMVFADPEGRRFYVDWDQVARDTAANLRLGWGREESRERAAEIVDELTGTSRAFGELWDRNDVLSKTTNVKQLDHPAVGRFELRFETFAVAGAGNQALLIYHAEPGTPGEAALPLLGSLAATLQGVR